MALCDTAEDLLLGLGQRYGIKRLYPFYEDLLEDKDIDAILIAVPDPFHVDLAEKGLQAGKHVLVEKPLGNNSTDCKKLIKTVETTGRKLQVGCMKRYDPGIAFAHEFIQAQLGHVFSVSGRYYDSSFRPAMQESLLPPLLTSVNYTHPVVDPKCNKQKYGLWTHSAHLFDNLIHLGGPINAVTAKLAISGERFSWHGLLEMGSGAVGHFELTVKVNEVWSEGYTLHGEGGSVHIDTFLPFYYRTSQVHAFSARDGKTTTPLGEHSNPFKNQLEAFARVVLEDLHPSPDVYDGLAVVQLIEAVEESVITNQRVVIPPHTRH